MLEPFFTPCTMYKTGREDRALLRSNPSARAGAGTRNGGIVSHGSPFLIQSVSAYKAKNLRSWSNSPTPYPDRCAIWHYYKVFLPLY